MGARGLERLALAGDETVLDAGCGSGRVTSLLVERVPRGWVIGVDASASMIEHARSARGSRAILRVGDSPSSRSTSRSIETWLEPKTVSIDEEFLRTVTLGPHPS